MWLRNRILRFLIPVFCLFLILAPLAAQAKTPYKTYTVNGYGEMQETQTAYTVNRILSLDEVLVSQDGTSVTEIDDLYIDGEGVIYVAAVFWDDLMVEEYGGVLVIRSDGQLDRIVTTKGLSNPKGVFKAPNNRKANGR